MGRENLLRSQLLNKETLQILLRICSSCIGVGSCLYIPSVSFGLETSNQSPLQRYQSDRNLDYDEILMQRRRNERMK